jgi:CRISPR-associated protein Cas2
MFESKLELMKETDMFYTVCYDITDNRIRYRVVKLLKGSGYRVQKSVFECPGLTEKQLFKLQDKLDRLINVTTDSVRFYRQCRTCLQDFEMCGQGNIPEIVDFQVY